MTHKETEVAIERLRAGRDDMWTADIIDALIGEDVTSGRTAKFIDALIDLLEQADPDTHRKLPLDADGETIHIGDEMQWRDGERFSVVAIGDNAVFFDDGDGYEYSTPDCVRHYHAPTVEDVLRVFARTVAPEIVWDDEMHDELFGEYAAKLREAMIDE